MIAGVNCLWCKDGAQATKPPTTRTADTGAKASLPGIRQLSQWVTGSCASDSARSHLTAITRSLCGERDRRVLGPEHLDMGGPLEAESRIDDLVAGVALCGSTVMEEARQRGVLGSRLDSSRNIRRSMMKAPWQDRAIQAALAGVACPWRHRLISRQLC